MIVTISMVIFMMMMVMMTMVMMMMMNADLDSQQMDFETLELKLIDGFIFGGAKLLFQCSFPKIRCIQMRKNSEN